MAQTERQRKGSGCFLGVVWFVLPPEGFVMTPEVSSIRKIFHILLSDLTYSSHIFKYSLNTANSSAVCNKREKEKD